MKGFLSKKKKWFGYTLFTVVVTAVFLFYRFPAAEFADYLETVATRSLPGFTFKVDRIKPGLPVGVRLFNSEVLAGQRPDMPVFKAAELFIGLQLRSLLAGKLKYVFNCQAYNGTISGWLDFIKGGEPGSLRTEVELDGIDLEGLGYLPGILGRRLKGSLDGTITYSGRIDSLPAGNASVALNLEGGEMELLKPVFGLAALGLDNVRFDAVLENSIMEAGLEFMGREIEGALSGTIRLREDFAGSGLDLKGTIQPAADFMKNNPDFRDIMKFFKLDARKGKYRIEIYGTIKDTRFKLL